MTLPISSMLVNSPFVRSTTSLPPAVMVPPGRSRLAAASASLTEIGSQGFEPARIEIHLNLAHEAAVHLHAGDAVHLLQQRLHRSSTSSRALSAASVDDTAYVATGNAATSKRAMVGSSISFGSRKRMAATFSTSAAEPCASRPSLNSMPTRENPHWSSTRRASRLRCRPPRPRSAW